MAENSKRERIILSNIDILSNVLIIKTIKRTLQSYSDLQRFATTQLPLIAVVGGLPVPVDHIKTRDMSVDQIISSLSIKLYVYFNANIDTDKIVSDLLDDIWKALYSNQSRDGLCLTTRITADQDYEYWAPYGAFGVTVIHKYKHNIEGI